MRTTRARFPAANCLHKVVISHRKSSSLFAARLVRLCRAASQLARQRRAGGCFYHLLPTKSAAAAVAVGLLLAFAQVCTTTFMRKLASAKAKNNLEKARLFVLAPSNHLAIIKSLARLLALRTISRPLALLAKLSRRKNLSLAAAAAPFNYKPTRGGEVRPEEGARLGQPKERPLLLLSAARQASKQVGVANTLHQTVLITASE